jgi:hypothetical protein
MPSRRRNPKRERPQPRGGGVERSPARPILDLFRMGLWPIGEVNGSFVVYAPEPAAAAPR